jgi:hypothetical protein
MFHFRPSQFDQSQQINSPFRNPTTLHYRHCVSKMAVQQLTFCLASLSRSGKYLHANTTRKPGGDPNFPLGSSS